MGRRLDRTGKQYGSLTVIGLDATSKAGNLRWSVKCCCGKIFPVRTSYFRTNKTLSCGCTRLEDVLIVAGTRFGRLVTLEQDFSLDSVNSHKVWKCQCDCGTVKLLDSTSLRNGNTLSCGCLIKDVAKVHGLSKSPSYSIWVNIRQRVNPASKGYRPGIVVDPRWVSSLDAFLEDVGERPNGSAVLRRRNLKEGFFKANCYWDTSHNRRTEVFYGLTPEEIKVHKAAVSAESGERMRRAAGSVPRKQRLLRVVNRNVE